MNTTSSSFLSSTSKCSAEMEGKNELLSKTSTSSSSSSSTTTPPSITAKSCTQSEGKSEFLSTPQTSSSSSSSSTITITSVSSSDIPAPTPTINPRRSFLGPTFAKVTTTTTPKTDIKTMPSETTTTLVPQFKERWWSNTLGLKVKIISYLGRGHFSTVMLGLIEDNPEAKVAVKVMKTSQNLNRERLMNEIKSMQNIDCPNVLKLYGGELDSKWIRQNGEEDIRHVLILEYANKGMLLSFFCNEKFEPDLALYYIRQLLLAVNAIHAAGYVHRDLKPENILLDNWYQIKIADFGFAKEIPPTRKMNSVCGTELYLAPEVGQSTTGYDGTKSDVWSCAIIIFVMFVGVPPWCGPDWYWHKWVRAENLLESYIRQPNRTDLHNDSIEARSEFWKWHAKFAKMEIPDSFKQLMQGMFAINPTRRFPIKYCSTHPWILNSTCFSFEKVIALMKERQFKMEAAHIRAIEAKKNEALRKQNESKISDENAESARPTEEPYRGEEPPGPTKWANWMLLPPPCTEYYTERITGTCDVNSLTLSSPPSAATPLPYWTFELQHEHNTVSGYNIFGSKKSLQELKIAITEQLVPFWATISDDEKKHQMKVSVPVNDKKINFRIKFYQLTTLQNESSSNCWIIVEFEKRQGCCMLVFADLYHKLLSNLSEYIDELPISTSPSSTSSSSS